MPCWPSAGNAKRKIRHSTAEAPADTQGRHTYGSSHCNSPRQHEGVLVRALSSLVIRRPHSTRRLYSFLSLRSFINFFSAPFLSAVKGSGKLATEIPRGLKIDESKQESQLMEPTKKSDSGESAKKTYSVSPADYRLLEEVGQGASATVYRAMYIPYNEIVAVKCLDLDRCNSNLDVVRKEAQTMSLIDHPNVVKGYCSFVVERYLWVVMPFMTEGSCLHLMKFAYPNGFEEHAIGSILMETLKALEYLHKHGIIHRDVKAGNILLDSSGVVKLSDFGITAGMFDKGDRQRSRNTFVGTPCWMAPEVMQPGAGYDFKADIWSFGITALELAHGHAPFSKYPPMKVLLVTLQNAPPGLDYDRDKKFSKSFKEMVAMCLVKDQTKRPTAEKLLKHSFFRNAKPPELSVTSLLPDMPPLWDRVKALQLKDAEQLALKKIPSAEQEALSMSEYQRGVSAWNFDIEDLKVQASLIVDDENTVEAKEDDGCLRNFINNKLEQEPSTYGSTSEKPLAADKHLDWTAVENQLPSESFRHDAWKALSGPFLLPNRASANSFSAPTLSFRGYGDYPEYKFKSNEVQIKGRFSVTSENVDIVKESQLRRSASVADYLFNPKQVPSSELQKGNINISLPASILMPHLQNLAQQTSFQQDLLTNLLNSMQQNDLSTFHSGMPTQTFKPENDVLVISIGVSRLLWSRAPDISKDYMRRYQFQVVYSRKRRAHHDTGLDTEVNAETTERERLLLVKISELQARMTSLTDQLTVARLKHTQLQQLNAAYLRRNGEEA